MIKRLTKWLHQNLFELIAFVCLFLLIGGLIIIKKNMYPDRTDIIDKQIIYTKSVNETLDLTLDFTPSPEDVAKSISDYVTVPEGGLDWQLLAKTGSKAYSYKDEAGEEYYGVQPEFDKALMPMDGQVVTMQGYMFPLDAGEEQSLFLFGPFPVGCPYHYHVGSALVIEAHGKEQLEFQYEPVTIEGKLELVPRDDEYNVFYRMHDVILKP